MRSQKGFTLIELLVVVAILGVLAAVATPNILSLMNEGKLAAANGEASTVQTASDAYLTSKGTPAPDVDALKGENLIRHEIVGNYTITQTGSEMGVVVGTDYGDTGFVWGTPKVNQWNK